MGGEARQGVAQQGLWYGWADVHWWWSLVMSTCKGSKAKRKQCTVKEKGEEKKITYVSCGFEGREN